MASRNHALIAACQRGLLPMVKSLYSIDKQKADPSGNTLLHIAAQNGRLEVVKYLITEKRCDPMCKGRDGETPLHRAIGIGHFDTVKYLIDEQQVDPSCRGERGETPLHKALRRGHFDIAMYLIDEQQVDLSCQDGYGNTALHTALHTAVRECASLGHGALYCQHQWLAIVKYLIDKQRVVLSYQNKDGNTPFHIAAGGRWLDLIKCLPCKKYSDTILNCKNRNNRTPLDLAAIGYDSDVIFTFFNEIIEATTTPEDTNNTGSNLPDQTTMQTVIETDGDPISPKQTSGQEPHGDPVSPPASTREPDGDPVSPQASTREPDGDPVSPQASTREPDGDPVSPLASTREPDGDPVSSPASTRAPDGDPVSPPASTREPNSGLDREPSNSSRPLPSTSGVVGEDHQELELDMDYLLEVSEYLLVLDHDSIYTVGKALGLNYLTLKKMRDIRSPTFPDDVIAAWLRKQDQVKSATWKSLVSALRSVGQNGIADKIEQKKHARMPSTLVELWSHPQLKPFILQNPKPTERVLGIGAYGSVEEVEIEGLIRAGKKFRRDLFSEVCEGTFCEQFTKEYACIRKLQHQHIVQYHGICSLPDSKLPVLVMERLETSLHNYLLHPDNANLDLAVKVSILRGIAKGLVYLHNQTPAIIHRDLTAKNVLLDSNLVPKISDFGNSQFFDIDPSSSLKTMSNVPGTLLYMPPEALHAIARYNTKLDIFSYGQLALFTATQVFPSSLPPATYYIYVSGGRKKQLLGRTEVERRKEHFDVLGDRHPLTKLIEMCLDNEPEERPKATAIETQLDDLRRTLRTK